MLYSTIREVKRIDVFERLALHEQVASEIRCAIADGEAKPFERLPPTRDLAAVLGVKASTARATHQEPDVVSSERHSTRPLCAPISRVPVSLPGRLRPDCERGTSVPVST